MVSNGIYLYFVNKRLSIERYWDFKLILATKDSQVIFYGSPQYM